MLSFSEEEWHGGMTIPFVARLMKQLKYEVENVKDVIGRGAVLSSDINEVAINYAINVGRIAALTEIFEYEPEVEDEQDT